MVLRGLHLPLISFEVPSNVRIHICDDGRHVAVHPQFRKGGLLHDAVRQRILRPEFSDIRPWRQWFETVVANCRDSDGLPRYDHESGVAGRESALIAYRKSNDCFAPRFLRAVLSHSWMANNSH